ncbi:MAG TPA: adenylate/guanylate cyclase domain-containing protein [Chitinophagales bacterium]|nr:adenylate/guanylate cyclase domain-containing protein [Chitinophagales bacterium]
MGTRIVRQTIIFQIICWVLAAYLFITVRVLGLAEYDHIRVVIPIRYSLTIIQGTIAAILIGTILGIVDLFLAKSTIRKRSFGFLVIVKALIYISTIIIVLSLIHFFSGIFADHDSVQQEFYKLLKFYQDKFLLAMLIYALVISFLVSFIKQVNQKFGPGLLWKMVRGKYFKPQQEERIFMFLDLQSSTTFAEKIGHVLFSEMIQDCFYDLATVVEKYRTEIYQYVGDEAVLSWKIKNGLLNHNCLRVFFAFDDVLKSRAEYYQEKYGFVPQFKAGVNDGQVMVAEVGEIKKEIAYHGDVLNTGARIQSRCNFFGKKLLISEHLKEQLSTADELVISFLAREELKGKSETVGIYSVERK